MILKIQICRYLPKMKEIVKGIVTSARRRVFTPLQKSLRMDIWLK